MPKVDLYTISGQKSGQIDLPKEIFGLKINEPLMAQAVRVYLAKQRKAKAVTKTRGEVIGSRRKIWRQKGTGRARHGDRYAPIFVGGGRAHGPTGQENYQLKLSKKMRRLALFSALSAKLKEGNILFIKGLDKVEPKTKQMAKLIENLKLRNLKDKSKFKLLIVLPSVLTNVIQGARNIEGVRLAQASLLNTYEVLNGGKLLFVDKSVEVLKETYLGRQNKKKENTEIKNETG